MNDHKLEIVLSAKNMSGRAFDAIQGRVTKLTKSVFSLKGAFAAAAGVTAFGAITKSAIDATAEIKRNAEMAGVSTQAFQELEHAAKQFMVTGDALTDGLKELSLRADEFAVTGGGSAAEAFERLGYSQEELDSKMRDIPGLLSEITDRMQGMGRAAQIRIADEIFGGQGGEQFVAMLRAGSGEMQRLRDQARSLGLVISDDLVNASAEAKAKIEALTNVLGAKFQGALASLSPKIAEMATSLTDWVVEQQRLQALGVDNFFSSLAESTSSVAASLAEIAKYASLRSITGTFDTAVELSKQGLLDLTEFARLSFMERQRLVDDILRKQQLLSFNAPQSSDVNAFAGAESWLHGEKLKALYYQGSAPDSIAPLPMLPEMPQPFINTSGGNMNDWLLLNQPGGEADSSFREIQEMLDRRNELFANKNNELIQLSERTSWAMQENFSDLFFDALTGELDSLGDYFDRTLKVIQRSLADYLGQMVTNSLFGSGGSGGGVSGLFSFIGGLFGAGSGGGGTSFTTDWSTGSGQLVAMANGGVITEPIYGFGMTSGRSYALGEHEAEIVTPLSKLKGQQPAGDSFNVSLNIHAADPASGLQFVKRNSAGISRALMDRIQRDHQFRRNMRTLLR